MTANLNLSIAEIVYDIQNKTYLTGKSRADGSNHQQVAQMMANEDEENANQIMRSIHSALGEIRNALAEYTQSGDASVTNTWDDNLDNVLIRCELPSNYNPSTLTTVAGAIHQYVVARAVAEWFTITDKADAADYQTQARQSLSTIAEALSKRIRPTRKISSGV